MASSDTAKEIVAKARVKSALSAAKATVLAVEESRRFRDEKKRRLTDYEIDRLLTHLVANALWRETRDHFPPA